VEQKMDGLKHDHQGVGTGMLGLAAPIWLALGI
jgi:hypothetical protein